MAEIKNAANNDNSYIEVMEFQAGTKIAKKIRCKMCGVVCFEVGDRPNQSELNSESIRMKAHLEIMHDLRMVLQSCSCKECLL